MATTIEVSDWRGMRDALLAARAAGRAPTLVSPPNAAALYGAGFLAALESRARREFPDIDFAFVVDCGDAPGHALACLRSGLRRLSLDSPHERLENIARQMGAELTRRPT
jgi:hypothetical protein